MSEGVEWAAHACLLLAALPKKRGLPGAALAEYHGVPAAYMAKQMQALARAGIVSASRGPRGGYRLARPLTEISLGDILDAIEGSAPVFHCTEIRRRGPCPAPLESCVTPCAIARAFHDAEATMRARLKETDLETIGLETLAGMTPERKAALEAWILEAMS